MQSMPLSTGFDQVIDTQIERNAMGLLSKEMRVELRCDHKVYHTLQSESQVSGFGSYARLASILVAAGGVAYIETRHANC